LTIEKIIAYSDARWKIDPEGKELKQKISSQQTPARAEHAVTNHLHFCMMAHSELGLLLRLNGPPQKHYMIEGRECLTFSNVRYAIANVIAQKEFSVFLNKKRKSEKNNFVTTFLCISGIILPG
jgi:hypothetical protein